MSTAERAKRVRPLLLAAGVWAAANLLDLLYPVFFDTWNERLSDQFLALKTAIPAFAPPYDEAVVHVDLNNTSLRALKDYHPTRAHYARVIHNLGAMKVAVQMCDVIFAGETGPENDRRLMEATRQSRDVVFGMAFRLSAAEEADEGVEDPEARSYLRKTAWKLPAAPETARFYHGVDPLITLVPLAELSLGTGFLTLIPDADGVMRRLPLIARFEDGFYPSFALKSVCAFLKVPPERVALERGAIILLDAVLPRSGRKARLTLPVDSRGCLRINFVGAWGRMRHYNFSDIYAASDDPDRLDEFREELEGRIALVSDISTGSADMGQVPIDETYPLSGVHANAVNTILTGSFIRELPSLAKAGTELLLLLAVTALSFHRSALVSSAGTVGLGGLFTISAGLALLNWNLMIPAAKPLVVMVLGWAGLSTWNALENARVRAEIERARQLAERELEIGRQIQTGFLPAKLPIAARLGNRRAFPACAPGVRRFLRCLRSRRQPLPGGGHRRCLRPRGRLGAVHGPDPQPDPGLCAAERRAAGCGDGRPRGLVGHTRAGGRPPDQRLHCRYPWRCGDVRDPIFGHPGPADRKAHLRERRARAAAFPEPRTARRSSQSHRPGRGSAARGDLPDGVGQLPPGRLPGALHRRGHRRRRRHGNAFLEAAADRPG